MIVQNRGTLNILDYLGLVVPIWASMGLDFATISTFYYSLSIFMGKLCSFVAFYYQSLGLTKLFNMLLVQNMTTEKYL